MAPPVAYHSQCAWNRGHIRVAHCRAYDRLPEYGAANPSVMSAMSVGTSCALTRFLSANSANVLRGVYLLRLDHNVTLGGRRLGGKNLFTHPSKIRSAMMSVLIRPQANISVVSAEGFCTESSRTFNLRLSRHSIVRSRALRSLSKTWETWFSPAVHCSSQSK